MSVGIPAIDEDHKGLFQLVNKLELCQTWEHAENIAKKLYAYTQLHFKREEEIQEYFNLPLKKRKDEHKKITNELHSMIKAHFLYNSPSTSVGSILENLIPLLRDLLLGHVLVDDGEMREFFKSQLFKEESLLSAKSHRFLDSLGGKLKRSKWNGLPSCEGVAESSQA